ncbi:hypothetical protein DSO57_1002449 [Entomophthora muscae]|uniref:Uncharacterized protein n=1 Tax=Entomophthora muscae TaxID=34485 RepID=A0ACC2RZV5_9FUNG|nr:hypothetical protein DSO57_1002449 [Entomophthora muscae]
MDLLDKKVHKILAQVSLEEELPHNTPNVKRYMGFFSPPNQNKVTRPTFPLICSAPVDNPPMETEEDWSQQATLDKREEVRLLQDIIANKNRPITYQRKE